MIRCYRVAPEAGLAVDQVGNPDTCYVRVEGETPEVVGRTLGQFGVLPEHLTQISQAQYIAATGESAA